MAILLRSALEELVTIENETGLWSESSRVESEPDEAEEFCQEKPASFSRERAVSRERAG